MNDCPDSDGTRVEMDAACTLIMVRHGESTANAQARFTLTDDEPLTAAGIEQARATGKALADRFRPRPNALYCSPYSRALHTAREIGEFLALEPVIESRLYEQSYGDFKGKLYTDYFDGITHVTGPERWRLTPAGGESLYAVGQRVRPAIRDIAERHRGESVVVVSHGGVMAAVRGFVADFEGVPQSTENAGGYRLVVDPVRGSIQPPQPIFHESPSTSA